MPLKALGTAVLGSLKGFAHFSSPVELFFQPHNVPAALNIKFLLEVLSVTAK